MHGNPGANWETMLRTQCILSMFCHVSYSVGKLENVFMRQMDNLHNKLKVELGKKNEIFYYS